MTFEGVHWSALESAREAAPVGALRRRARRGGLHRERPDRVPPRSAVAPRDPRRRRATDARARRPAAPGHPAASTSGRARSGSAASSSPRPTARASGSATATTTTRIPSRRSATASEGLRFPPEGGGSRRADRRTTWVTQSSPVLPPLEWPSQRPLSLSGVETNNGPASAGPLSLDQGRDLPSLGARPRNPSRRRACLRASPAASPASPRRQPRW